MSRPNVAVISTTNSSDKNLDAGVRQVSRKKVIENKSIAVGSQSPGGLSRPKASIKLVDTSIMSQKQRAKSTASPQRSDLYNSGKTEIPLLSQSNNNNDSKLTSNLIPRRQASESDSIDSNGLAVSSNTLAKRGTGDRRDDSFTQISRNTNASISTASPSLQTETVVLSDTDGSSDYYGSARQSRLHSESDSKGFGTLASRTTPFEEEDEHDDDDDEDEIIDASLTLNFLMEHRIFLKAALNLLTERDQHAPELGMMDPIVLKSGPLKKASHLMNGVWKVKYVEVRRGMFSYYENAVSKDSQGEGELLRKNIPLEASTVTCRAVKLHQKALKLSPTGAIFELESAGSKRLWMANSREERSVWIQAINNAIVGGSVTRGGDPLMDHSGYVRHVSGRSPFKNDLRKYLKAQAAIKSAKTKIDYVAGLRDILNKPLQIPVKWIAKQGDNEISDKAFQEETVALSIDQLWKDLLRDTVSIDGEVYHGDAIHGPERILGALTKRILTVAGQTQGARSDLRESQALIYARDILLAGNRTRSAGDSYYCVNTLCSSPNLVVVVPSGTAVSPVEFEVSEDNSDESVQSRFLDKSGWIKTRNYLQRTWSKLFFVLSEGTLSYFVGALPRPHGLRGQRSMKEATISITRKPLRIDGKTVNRDQFILKLSTDDSSKDRMLLFESVDKLLDWVYALECVTKPNKKVRRRTSGSGATATDDPGQSGNPSSMLEIMSKADQATRAHAVSIGIDNETLESRLSTYTRRATSAVSVSVNASTDYKVCTLDPTGDVSLDTWACLTAHFGQSFRVTGGPNGRIIRGEETVRVIVTHCAEAAADMPSSADGPPVSPTSMRGRMNRTILGYFGSNDEPDANVIDANDG